MRQAGRYMSDYRALRERYSLLEICRIARARGRRDAAAGGRHRRRRRDSVLGSADSLHADGPRVRFRQGRRPVDRAPDSLRGRRGSAAPLRAARGAVARARDDPACFAASSPIACRSSGLAARRSRSRPTRSKAARRRPTREPRRSCTRSPRRGIACANDSPTMMSEYLAAQVEAGAQALQIFDSWAGALGRADYREFAHPHSSRIFVGLRELGVPVIHFGVGTTAILPDLAEAGGDVIGVDWRQPLDEAWSSIGHDRGHPGESRSDSASRAARSPASPRPTMCCAAPADARDTSSISATAFCRTRRSNTCRNWRSTCIGSNCSSQLSVCRSPFSDESRTREPRIANSRDYESTRDRDRRWRHHGSGGGVRAEPPASAVSAFRSVSSSRWNHPHRAC